MNALPKTYAEARPWFAARCGPVPIALGGGVQILRFLARHGYWEWSPGQPRVFVRFAQPRRRKRRAA